MEILLRKYVYYQYYSAVIFVKDKLVQLLGNRNSAHKIKKCNVRETKCLIKVPLPLITVTEISPNLEKKVAFGSGFCHSYPKCYILKMKVKLLNNTTFDTTSTNDFFNHY